MAERSREYLHISEPDLFREALAYTEAKTGFQASMIETDYYCSLVLATLFRKEGSLVFKGGTCISKVYTEFYRLSEDLDFIIPVATNRTRKQRRAEIKSTKRAFDDLPEHIPGITISEHLVGHNENRQYLGTLAYSSAVIDKKEQIKIEIGLREPLLLPSQFGVAKTLVQNPFIAGQPMLPAYEVQAISLAEDYAEKVRAALTRREPAIRDFFDLSPLVIDKIGLDLQDSHFLAMVREKVNVTGKDSVDVSPERKIALDQQLEKQLRPVLRVSDFLQFDLATTFERIVHIAELLA